MIKFFRKIRQNLLIENKFSKYLLYAIGEIILVVIGILIALQINNNNEISKTAEKENRYLTLIRNEMNNNLKSLKDERIKLAICIVNQRTILELMRNEFARDTISEKQLSRILVDAISEQISINYENGVLTELIVSANLKDIKNENIRNKLSSWESKVFKIRGKEKQVLDYWIKSNDFLELNGLIRTIFDQTTYSDYVELERLSTNASNKDILNSSQFENILLIQLASSMHLEKGVYPIYQTELVELIELIDEEIKKLNE